MRKLTSHLFISLDGVVEAPDTFVRPNLYADFDEFTCATVAEQDAILLGRKTYQAWSTFWPDSTIEPFASFINNNQKIVVSSTLEKLEWRHSILLNGELATAVGELKARPGKTIGVHGSISLVQSLLVAGLLDELHFILCPVMAGHGRRLLDRQGDPVQLDLKHSRSTPAGLQYLVYTPRP
ncbi:dihydrofolate reductase family protein [Massilia antarctica]|uniref:Dihydrofolate reductase family protein n=1 Tax=Massilia antarctica TaxID=2765360 RepID=A0AA48WAB0_9BURK|nr:dihydrofolate reductase family protein [Massilia antarctica]QPI48717.1 dihydrofolate reductase family protein [Massilia antarctica]